MARPRTRYGEAGEGVVRVLCPEPGWLSRVRDRRWSMEEYRGTYLQWLRMSRELLAPGSLMAIEHVQSLPSSVSGRMAFGIATVLIPVGDGDTLLCCCSREKARAGKCHRCWAAEALGAAGWRVVLDGQVLSRGPAGG